MKLPIYYDFAVEVYKGSGRSHDVVIKNCASAREAFFTVREMHPRARLGVVRNLGESSSEEKGA